MSGNDSDRFPFDAIVEMSDRLKVYRIGDLPGCWEYQIDEAWWIAVNGHKEPVSVFRPQHPGVPVSVPPFTAYIEYNGWPAGLIDPARGTMAAGEGANQDAFMAACDAVAKTPRQRQA